MSKLVRWNTPFADVEFPSALVVNTRGDKGEFLLNVVVSPRGLDAYPKYLVDFGEAIAFACFEEACAPERDFTHVEVEERRLSAYEYLSSPWLESYGPCFDHFGDALRHYLIFGGDSNIEVLTKKRPTFELIESSKVIALEFAI